MAYVKFHQSSPLWGTGKANRFGHITSVSVSLPASNLPLTADPLGYFTDLYPQPGRVEFSGVAEATPEVLSALRMWMDGGLGFKPVYQPEWMCLYCGSPQKLERTHCEKCGAPRSWLIG